MDLRISAVAERFAIIILGGRLKSAHRRHSAECVYAAKEYGTSNVLSIDRLWITSDYSLSQAFLLPQNLTFEDPPSYLARQPSVTAGSIQTRQTKQPLCLLDWRHFSFSSSSLNFFLTIPGITYLYCVRGTGVSWVVGGGSFLKLDVWTAIFFPECLYRWLRFFLK